MPRRRPSKRLQQQLTRPRQELSLPVRGLLWAFRSEASAVLAIGVLFAVGMAARYLPGSTLGDARPALQVALSLLVFGVFFGVIVVTEDQRAYRQTGSRIRVLCGALALGAISALWAAPIEVIAFSAVVGAMLGYAGKYWVRIF